MFHTPLICPAHGINNRENILTLFCSKETCQKPICLFCRFVSCKESDGHIIFDLKEASASSKFHITNEIEKIQITRQELEEVKSVVESEIEELDRREFKLEAKIDSTIDEMIAALEKKRHELKSDLNRRTECKRKTLQNQKTALAERVSKIDQGMQFAKQALCSTNDAAFLQIDKTIMNRLYRLHHDPFDRKPHERAFVWLFSEENSELQRVLTENLNVWSTSIFSPTTTIKILDNGTENRLKKIVVFLRDHQKHPVETVSLENVTITVVDPSGALHLHLNLCAFSSLYFVYFFFYFLSIGRKNILIPTQDPPSEFGTLVISFEPFTSGTHQLSLEIMGQVVYEKDFDVAPDDWHSGQCKWNLVSVSTMYIHD
jgi:hypothetical protein